MLELYDKCQIRNSLLAGITLAATNTDPVLVLGILMAFRHQAHNFGIAWIPLVQEAVQSLPQPTGDWLLSVSEGRMLTLTET